jgi:hypothetical protein
MEPDSNEKQKLSISFSMGRIVGRATARTVSFSSILFILIALDKFFVVHLVMNGQSGIEGLSHVVGKWIGSVFGSQ